MTMINIFIKNTLWNNEYLEHNFLNIKMGVQMFVCLSVCLSVGMWRANANSNPCTDLDEILHTHPHLSNEGFGTSLTPAPTLLGLGNLNL